MLGMVTSPSCAAKQIGVHQRDVLAVRGGRPEQPHPATLPRTEQEPRELGRGGSTASPAAPAARRGLLTIVTSTYAPDVAICCQ